MGIFPILTSEKTIQVRDTIRLDASKSFVSKGTEAIIGVEIEPEAGAGFADVFVSGKPQEWYLDWQYTGASRFLNVAVRVTIDDAVPPDPLDPINNPGSPATTYTADYSLEVISAEDDALFSDDADLFSYEEEIFKLLPRGKTSFNYKHRRAQTIIVENFNERGVVGPGFSRISKANLVDIDDVRQWSICLTLAMIYEDNSKTVGDTFFRKSESYYSMALAHKHKAFYRIDYDGNGTATPGEINPFFTAGIVRR